MRKGNAVESAKDRVHLAHEAGMGRVSLGSVLAGTLVAFGAFAVLGSLIGGIASAAGVDVDMASRDWSDTGVATGITLCVVLLVSYLAGGYVAGRMARRSGALNGLLTFVLGLLIAAGVGAFVGAQTGGDELLDGLRGVGLPTTSDELRTIGSIAGVAALLSMMLGAIIGGRMGDRWHTKLMRRAADPTVGPNARSDEHDITPGHIDLRDRNDDRRDDRRDTDHTDYEPAHAGGGERMRGEADRPMAARNREAERWNPNNTDPRA